MNKPENGLAFVFPGQGSQSVGMLRELADNYPEVGQTFATASAILGYDLWRLVMDGPTEDLNLTEHTQPAMLAAGVAAYRVWLKQDVALPSRMAGHSLGEYTALVCSNALKFEDAVKLVAERARLMQNAVAAGTGGMAAIIGLDDDRVAEVCSQISTQDNIVSPANFNSPGQVVIAGHTAAVAEAIDALKLAGAKKAVVLPVSVPSHCPLMADAALKFRLTLAAVPFHAPEIAIVHNADVSTHTTSDAIRSALERQLYSPVRWSETIRFLEGQGINRYIECGPGKVLAGLTKRIAKESMVETLFDPNSLNKALELVQ